MNNRIFSELPASEKMPALFIGHGSPMNAIEDNQFVEGWRKLGNSLPPPAAILCISAHWETEGTRVTAMPRPPTIHDFGGFPPELYQVQYPAPGDPRLAAELSGSVKGAEVKADLKWGLDHGAWSVIRRIYPEADVPVVQLSLDYNKTPRYHYELAKELAYLRTRGVLVIGSGNMVHNLRMIAWDKMNEPAFGFDWAIEASELFKRLINEKDHARLIDYLKLGSEVRLAVPTPDHFLPLLYALALQEKNETVSFFNDEAVLGSLTMTSLQIGA
ncbi:MAG: 4,5-DOPA dioxygenase extradiol [Bacteroidota bacterium]